MAQVTLPTVITATDVEDAAIATLKPRLEYYLEQLGLPIPRAWTRQTRFNKWPEDQVPAIIIYSPGLAEEPNKRGTGEIDARWTLGIAALVSARDQNSTDRLAKEYGALIRASILQESSLGGFARGVDWMDESYDEIDVMQNRTLSAAEMVFSVEVEGVVNARELPYMPDGPIPTPSDFVVGSVDVSVENAMEVNP